MGQPQNPDKTRKSDAQEVLEQADNAGRFAGTDADSEAARQQAQENVRQDTNSSRGEKDTDSTDAEARRDYAQSHDYKGEAQNVNDDTGRPLTNEDELQDARNKAVEGKDETKGIP